MAIDKKILKASYKDCPVFERKLFKQSSCLLPISIFQPVHEGEKLEATVELIGRTFKTCTILVDDIVQRHTLKISFPQMSESELYQMALNEGDSWIGRSKNILEKLTIPYNIIRWEDWLLHPNFGTQLMLINNLYITNSDYKQAIDLTIIEYLTRNKKNGKDFNSKASTAICLDYLKEECAAMTLWVEGQYEFEVYPTGRNKAMAATYRYLIEPIHPHLLKSVAIRFKKY